MPSVTGSRNCHTHSDTPHYGNDVPFEVPESWVWQKLGDIGVWQSGATPSRLNKDYYGGDIPWLKTGDLNDGYIYEIPETITQKALKETSVKLNPAGSVLIAMYGATIGKIGILTYPATTNQACCACVDYQGIEQMYLFYFLLSHREEFIMLGGGGAQPNISKEKIADTFIPIPPLIEQQRLVKAIELWFALIDKLETAKVDLQTSIFLAKSKILDLAIHGKLVPQDPNDEPAIELLKRINPSFVPCDNGHDTNKLPSGWEKAKLKEICQIIMGSSPSGENINSNKNGVEFHQGKLFFTDLYLNTSNTYTDSVTKLAPKNSILLCVRAPVGIVNISSRSVCIGRGLCAIVPQDEMNLMFLFYAIQTLKPFFEENATGTTFKAIGGDIVRESFILLPPSNEQLRIVAKIEEIFAVLDEIQKSIED